VPWALSWRFVCPTLSLATSESLPHVRDFQRELGLNQVNAHKGSHVKGK
jgi:hypothetical protein